MQIRDQLVSKLGQFYVFGARENAELLSIVDSWHSYSIEQQHKRMQRLLSRAKPIALKANERSSYKSGEIESLLNGKQVTSVLDLGAGSGDIVTAVAKKLGLEKKSVFALTVTKLAPSKIYSVITYDKEGKIPLPNQSIDLVIVAQVLHHIHPEERKQKLAEIRRVLSPSGTVVIQEHDYRGDLETYMSLDILHTFWYVKNREEVDGLFLMSQEQTALLFSAVGMRRDSHTPALPSGRHASVVGWQRTYWAAFSIGASDKEMEVGEYITSSLYLSLVEARAQISTDLLPFDPISLYLSSWNKHIPYHSVPIPDPSHIAYWGQLKIFLSVLQALLEFWDPVLVPDLTVVYAGAAPGWSFGVLEPMFPTVTWHLYDPGTFHIKEIPGKMKLYKQFFTEVTAQQWSQYDNIFFFSDIRREGKDTIQGLELETKVMEDMAEQARWTLKMNPYRASLKFRAPYLIENLPPEAESYLDGNIMLQSFNSSRSAEARLIPIRDPQSGKYYSKKYDWKRYEDVMFYHNAVVREKARFAYDGEAYAGEEGRVEDASGVDNHFDSVHLLTVLDEYRKRIGTYQVGSSSVPLAKTIMSRLSSYSKRGEITLARIRKENLGAD